MKGVPGHFVASDGVALATTVYGGPAPTTLFLSHCVMGDQREWRYQVAELASTYKLRIVTWDQRGHAGSDRLRGYQFTFDRLGRDLGDLIDAYAPTGSVVLAGHSMGAFSMITLGDVRPDLMKRVRGAAFIATSASAIRPNYAGPTRRDRIRAGGPRVLAIGYSGPILALRNRLPALDRRNIERGSFGLNPRPADIDLVLDQTLACPKTTAVRFDEEWLIHDRMDSLAAYRDVPTRILVGDRDVLTPPAHARRMTEALPKATLTVLPDAGHMLPLERDAFVTQTLAELVEGAR